MTSSPLLCGTLLSLQGGAFVLFISRDLQHLGFKQWVSLVILRQATITARKESLGKKRRIQFNLSMIVFISIFFKEIRMVSLDENTIALHSNFISNFIILTTEL